jgi:murein DD-endopeptidase MepM/ murein hydrolase activator NlpD
MWDNLLGFWKSKKLTILIIPSATQSTRRISISKFSLAGIWILSLVIFSTICSLLLYMNHQLQFSDSRLDLQYEKKYKLLSSQISNKDQRLADLESMLYDLTTQTNDFKSKLEDLKELKNVMDVMDKTSSKQSSLIYQNPFSSEASQGGNFIAEPLTNVDDITTKAINDMKALSFNIDNLLVELEKKEEDLIAQSLALAKKPTIWPTDSNTISSVFGYRKDPFNNKPSFHSGLDIDGDVGDRIYASADGTVEIVGYDSVQGNHIKIKHGNSIQTAYLHLSKISVSANQKVVKGQLIGYMGSTGRSTGPHLHYEVLVNNEQVNPQPYLLEKIR